MIQSKMGQKNQETADLAASTTRKASLQTYYTIRFLADRDRLADAYRTYGYFRWVDDWIDQGGRLSSERLEFIRRQTALIDGCYEGRVPFETTTEEAILVDLVRSNPSPGSGLASYIRNMLEVMSFDAGRRGRLISQAELSGYTLSLAIAITEAIHYFIGHDQASPHTATRLLVTAAHITHMLRDTREDLEAGYFNIPIEFLRERHISIHDLGSPSYRAWVQRRVDVARRYFKAGRAQLSQVKSARCRLACLAYTARFEIVLDMIERDGWLLRAAYQERKNLGSALRMGQSILSSTIGGRVPPGAYRIQVRR